MFRKTFHLYLDRAGGTRRLALVACVACALVGAALLSGCGEELVGNLPPTVQDDSNTPPDSNPGVTTAECTAEPGPPELRRLSSDQYDNTLRDLFPGQLGEDLAAAATYPATVISYGFANDAAANNINESESNQIEDNAAELSLILSARVSEAMPCVTDPASSAQYDACIDAFIDDLGPRAFRRPLRDSERSLLKDIYQIGREQSGRVGFESVMELVLQSPAMLYQVEYGAEPVPGSPGVFTLTEYELATRLSYFLWNTTPDSGLLAAAAAGELSTREGLERQARRLVQDPRVFDTLETFHRDLTRTYRLDQVGRDDPGFTPAMRDAMRREGRLFLEAADARGELNFAGIFATDRYPVSPELAEIYGVTVPSGAPTEMSIPNRRGILATPSAMASISTDDSKNSTIVRAIYILEEVLCQALPPFPGDIDSEGALDEAMNSATARDRLAPTTNNATCNGCHQSINPPGFALEQFDSIGRYRTVENGATIDASGELAFAQARGEFGNSTEFLELVASSEAARTCYVKQWMHSALGRSLREAEECTVDELSAQWANEGDDLRELLVQIALNDRFRHREVKEEQE